MNRSTATLALVLALSASSEGFAPIPRQGSTFTAASTTTQLQFGIPTFGAKDSDKKKADATEADVPEKSIDFKGLLQLVTAGMGSPFLGDFEGVDEETGNFMFSLEANNLVDEVCRFSLHLSHVHCYRSSLLTHTHLAIMLLPERRIKTDQDAVL